MNTAAPQIVVAIDGPAASGKSSVARELARRLGFVYVNSGAIYRAVTWHMLQKGIDVAQTEAIVTEIASADLVCDLVNRESRVRIDGLDPVVHLREPAVNASVSGVSSVPLVREKVGAKLRSYAIDYHVVVEGRDIGSVVFPLATYKFYVDASPDVRFGRRAAEKQQDQIAARDQADAARQTAPLVIAPDAHVIDTSELTIDEVVGLILTLVQSRVPTF